MTTAARLALTSSLSAVVAFAAGALGAIFVLAISRGSDEPVIAWLGDWMKTAGFAGVCAIVAATLALVGISAQLRASRKRDADSRWWLTFEWASDRGLPRNPSEPALPFEATIDTFNALATTALTDIQRSAVGGLVDHVIRVHEAGSRDDHSRPERVGDDSHQEEPREPVTSTTPEHPAETDESERAAEERDSGSLAILRYALQQMGTAAESRRANAMAYESEVTSALRHQYEFVTRTGGGLPGDLAINTGKRRLLVDVIWTSGTARRYRAKPERNVDVVISNGPVVDLPPGTRLVRWRPGEWSSVLRRALDSID